MRRQPVATMLFAYGLLVAGAVQAQDVAFARKPGDTLRFHDVIRIDGLARGPAGEVRTQLSREGVLSIRFLRSDSAIAWYDSLSALATSPASRREDTTARVLNAPFVLQLTADGGVTVLREPELTPVVRELAQYTPQFDDFFPRLPSTMEIGAVRTDTIVRTQPPGSPRRLMVRRVVRYRIDKDTVFAGRPAYRITTSADVHIDASAPLRQQPDGLTLLLDGVENGSAIVTRSGYLLSRVRTGSVQGTITYAGGGTRVSVTQGYTYQGITTARSQGR